MKSIIFLFALTAGLNTWAAEYKKCTSPQYTLALADNTDAASKAQGVTTIITLFQNRGGVPLPILANESQDGNVTVYDMPSYFHLEVTRARGKTKDFKGVAVMEGYRFDLICN